MIARKISLHSIWTRTVGASFVFHFLILALIFFLPAISPLSFLSKGEIYYPMIKVDLVELPDKLPYEIEAEMERAREAGLKKADFVYSTKIAMADAIDKIRAFQKIEEELEKEREKKMEAAIKDIVNQKVKGNIPTPGAFPFGGDFTGDKSHWYVGFVVNKIRQNWYLPPWLEKDLNLKAWVRVFINREGKLIEAKFARDSGNQEFDRLVVESIEKSFPLKPPPDEDELQAYLRKRGIPIVFPKE